jgi:hypothetical protein
MARGWSWGHFEAVMVVLSHGGKKKREEEAASMARIPPSTVEAVVRGKLQHGGWTASRYGFGSRQPRFMPCRGKLLGSPKKIRHKNKIGHLRAMFLPFRVLKIVFWVPNWFLDIY